MMTEELKPCPFCGAEARLTELPTKTNGTFVAGNQALPWLRAVDAYSVGCDRCDIGMTNPYLKREAAVIAWNRRVAPTIVPTGEDANVPVPPPVTPKGEGKVSLADAAQPQAGAATIAVLREALKPFAACADQLDGDADVQRAPDDEWAKFRLLASDYRRARSALDMVVAQPQAVSVKPLVWKPWGPYGDVRAETPIGHMEIMMFSEEWHLDYPFDHARCMRNFRTFDEATATAQQIVDDFMAQWLEPSPVRPEAVVKAEALREMAMVFDRLKSPSSRAAADLCRAEADRLEREGK